MIALVDRDQTALNKMMFEVLVSDYTSCQHGVVINETEMKQVHENVRFRNKETYLKSGDRKLHFLRGRELLLFKS